MVLFDWFLSPQLHALYLFYYLLLSFSHLLVFFRPFSSCCHFISVCLCSFWLQEEQMALIHNLFKSLTQMKKDMHTERERQQETRDQEKRTRLKAIDSLNVTQNICLNPFLTTKGNKEISGIYIQYTLYTHTFPLLATMQPLIQSE